MDMTAATLPGNVADDANTPAAESQAAHDRRRYRRVPVGLKAKIILPGGQEAPGRLVDVCAGGASIEVPVVAPVGETVIAYADRIGRVEGKVIRPTRDGFVVAFSARASRAKRLADALIWVCNTAPERDRRGARRFAKQESATLLRESGDAVACRILDISTGGASVGIDAHERPSIGERITLGVMTATVVRHHEDGIGVAFARLPRAGTSVSPHDAGGGPAFEETNAKNDGEE